MGELSGRVAIVTGGSGDLGGAIARELHRMGADVAIVGRTPDKLASVLASFEGPGRRLACARDLKDAAQAATAVAEVTAAFGRLDLLVNCAGNFRRGDLLALDDADWIDGFQLMFFAAVRMTKAAWPHLKASRGQVICVSGVHGKEPHAISTLGGALCASLINFTKSIAETGTRDGVRANCVVPGWMESQRLRVRLEQIARAEGLAYEEAKRRMQEEQGVMRFGRTEELGAFVGFLASDRASIMHGQAYVLDGGFVKGM